jgi:hypothetical protein
MPCLQKLRDYNLHVGFTKAMRYEPRYQVRIAEIAKRPACGQVFGVFGAGNWGHRFELTRHSLDEIVLLEEQLGVHLPEDYKQILLETGSGAGPYYGLFAPGRILAEIELWRGIRLEEDGVLPSPTAPFPFRQSDANEICLRRKIDPSDDLGRATYPSDGCIAICCHGCTFFSVLVTAGEQLGRVWGVNSDGWPKAEWRPAERPPGLLGGLLPDGTHVRVGQSERGFLPRTLSPLPTPPTFLQWYESWLERVETDLDDYRDYKARAEAQ